ncbi:hypothetical protein HHK36_024287 [Tetracentron sinense]|uniref:Uncharacterized protein n=1 Tax=Tetracentron sinense TaxID=13715 RepID=A0A834YNL1_TETSI|nr:hypothetical protein HHK36_024287 [Tetracentron sinense]
MSLASHREYSPLCLFPRNITCYGFDESKAKLIVYLPSACEISFKDSFVISAGTKARNKSKGQKQGFCSYSLEQTMQSLHELRWPLLLAGDILLNLSKLPTSGQYLQLLFKMYDGAFCLSVIIEK